MSMIGKSLLHYEISAQIGRGGMGEVYQAKDTKLGRDVAIKILPEEFAKDSDRVARFQREAKLLASLNHPNIAAIYGLEESNGTNFLVMELIEGDTLADRIKTGPIPVEEALKLALQIVEALETAHEKGVIHRDLKPANIKVTPEGKVKVLDFGLAKAFAEDQGEMKPLDSPTLSNAATMRGVILGTAAYMSPEQAKGKSVDKRADIWAFGVIVFEMLTGQQLFTGETASETLAAVMMRDPDFSILPPNLHARIKFLLERCLEKNPRKRYSGISDAWVDIDKALADPDGVLAKPVDVVKPKKKLHIGIPWLATAIVLSLIVAGVTGWMLKPIESPKVIKFRDVLREGLQFAFTLVGDVSLAVSPDGNHVAYNTNEGLYLRSIDQLNARLISETEGYITSLSFSPDGQWICYFSESERKIKKMAISGGAPFAICDAEFVIGTSWPKEDTILYGDSGNIYKVSSHSGNAELLIEGGAGPQLLPDGDTVLFIGFNSQSESSKIAVQSLKSGERKSLFVGQWAYYLPTKHIVYELESNIYAVPFDIDSFELTGGSASLVEEVNQFAVSTSGTLAYVRGGINTQSQLQWYDRQGTRLESIGGPASYSQFSLSPDGKRVAIEKGPAGRKSLWVLELDRNGVGFPIVPDLSSGVAPIWSPDGDYIAFRSGNKIYRKSLTTEEKPELLLELKNNSFPIVEDWSDDGRFIFYKELSGKGQGLWKLPLFDDKTPILLVQGSFNYDEPKFSPNGKWMVYMSDETGQWEVYIRPLDREGERRIISTQGGAQPKWRGDGKELYYLALDGSMMAVELKGEQLTLGVPHPLFQTGIVVTPVQDQYAVTRDGQRFIILTSEQKSGGSTLNIVVNWLEELKQRVPVD